MEIAELEALAGSGEVDTVVVAFTDHYGRNMGKRLDAGFFLDEVAERGTHGCDYLLTADMEMEPVPGYRYANWELGYGDLHLAPDLTTLRRAGWTDRSAFVLCDVVDGDHHPVEVAPRAILRRQVERVAAAGYRPKAASELEFFLFTGTYRDAHAGGYADLRPAGWYIEDYHLLPGARVEGFVGEARRALSRSGIPVESSKGEWGRGQQEINVRYADVLAMADLHTTMKQAMKELADSMGLSVTFMAKPHTGEAGSSCHIHLSLWHGDGDGANAFAGDAPGGTSDVFRWFLGGWMAHLQDFMVLYAPTVNSYKRYRDGSWAPTRIAWSRDNRTAGFRIVGSGPTLRIECRVPGADVNPYLAYAAALASGLHGIRCRTEPPPEVAGDAYADTSLDRVPVTLERALERFRASEVAAEALGPAVVEHYAHFFAVEVDAYNGAVTDWERARYFERI